MDQEPPKIVFPAPAYPVKVVGGAAPAAADAGFPDQADVLIAELRARGLGARDIRDVVVATFGTGKKETYQRVLDGSA